LDHQKDQFSGLKDDLKSIPLWPSFCVPSTELLISADRALMATDRRLLVPWMKDRDRFINPQSSSDPSIEKCLSHLGVKRLSVETLIQDYVLPLPTTLNDIEWEYFEPLIEAIRYVSSECCKLLKQSKIAADGERNLRNANELFDHDDQISVAAFRHESKTRFLHASLQKHRTIWRNLGLRQQLNDDIESGSYIECLQTMSQRLSADDSPKDPYLEKDSQTVLSPLTTFNFRVHGFSARDWLAISQEQIFASRRVFNYESEYRKTTMETVAAQRRLLRLSEVIFYDHAAVCWSQTSFVTHEPTKEVMENISGKGQPQIDMVWRHLLHMKEIAQNLKRHQIRDFLADLQTTYRYLQGRQQESKKSFKFKNNAVWLNLNSWDHNTVLLVDVKSSWYGIENLVLSSSCDAGSVKAVRPGLMNFETLLKTLGCKSIIYPTVTRPELHQVSSFSNSVRQLRKEGKLLDITYSTEGRQIQAHKLVLAAVSKKCCAQFSGPWKNEDLIKYDEEDPDTFLSYQTLSSMIDYAYEDEIDWKEMEVSEKDDDNQTATKLNLLLDLLLGADSWLMPALKSQVEDKILVAGKAFINLTNVKEVQEIAEQAGSKDVKRMCAEFIQQNHDIIEKVDLGIS
jgi:sacsin